MYLSEAEEIVAYIVCIAIIIGFVATPYMEIKNTIAEDKQKQKERNKREHKVKTQKSNKFCFVIPHPKICVATSCLHLLN